MRDFFAGSRVAGKMPLRAAVIEILDQVMEKVAAFA
jgi:hypothetical protein